MSYNEPVVYHKTIHEAFRMETIALILGILAVISLASSTIDFTFNNQTTDLLLENVDFNDSTTPTKITFGDAVSFEQQQTVAADQLITRGGFVMPTRFVYQMSAPDLCKKYGTPYIISFVHSRPSHFEYRQVIRNTWANPKYFSKLGIVNVFVLGEPAESLGDNSTIDDVYEEFKTYGDIVMSDFIDSHVNLTYKNLAAMRWIQQYCLKNVSKEQQPRYVLKADDDVFIDSFRLIRLMRYLERTNFREDLGDDPNQIPATMRRTFYGYTKTCNQANRSSTSRYYLSVRTYPRKWFPGKIL